MELLFIQLLFVQPIFNELVQCAGYCAGNGKTGVKELTSDFRGLDKPRC